MKHELKQGDIIRDIEDGDCYYEGIVTVVFNNKPEIYMIQRIVWNGVEDKSEEGNFVSPQWWYLEVLIDGNWVKL